MTSPEDPSKYDIFISYASLDRPQVEILVNRLKSGGFRVWYDQQQIGRGQVTLGQLADAITASLHMIVCLSDAYIDREYTKFELDLNQSMDPANIRNRTVPVIVKPLTNHSIPSQIKAINFGNLTDPAIYEEEYNRIIRNITRHEAAGEPEPINPHPVLAKLELPFKEQSAEPIVILTQIRIAVEALCRFLYRLKNHKVPSGLGFSDLVDQAAASHRMPSSVKMALDSVKGYGNFPVFDQDEDAPFTMEAIRPGLAALQVLRNWFTAEFAEKKVELSVEPDPESTDLRTPSEPFRLTLRIDVPAAAAWALTGDVLLVLNRQTRELELWGQKKRLWGSGAPFPLRRWMAGGAGAFAAAGWDGIVYLFQGGELTARVVLNGTIGDLQFHSGRWVVGTWKTTLVSIAPETGEVVPLVDVHEGVAGIATMPSGDWFAVLDLAGGIGIYTQGRKVIAVEPFKDPRALAFAGRNLMVLAGHRLATLNLKGEITADRELSSDEISLHASPTGEVVYASIDQRELWSINAVGVQRREYLFGDFPRILVSVCLDPHRLLFAAPESGFEYWQAREKRQSWTDAQAGQLSLDGHRMVLVRQDQVELYEETA